MPPAIVTRHLSRIFRHSKLTVPVVFGSQSTRGLLDRETVIQNDGQGDVPHTATFVTIHTGSLTSVRQNSRLTIDGTVYEVRADLPHEDGETTRYLVAAVLS